MQNNLYNESGSNKNIKSSFSKIIKSEFFENIKNVLNFRKSAVLFSYVVRLKVLSSYILFFANVVFFLTYIFSLFLVNSTPKHPSNPDSSFTIEIFFWIAVVFNLLVYAIYIVLNSWFSKIIKLHNFTKNLLAIIFVIFLSFIILIFLVTPKTANAVSNHSLSLSNGLSLALSIIGACFIIIFIFTNLALDNINNKLIKKINFKIIQILKELGPSQNNEEEVVKNKNLNNK